ncbi:MAG TPA: 6-phosphogluconolactonase [Candidatus Saccharimonadales bacterium]|nr:6-phosphogluconolactonase [Candidatus Saccharimonadales bacterium]
MTAIRYLKEADTTVLAGFLAAELNELARARGSILVLLSGGSAIDLAVKLRQLIDVSAGRWCFSLADERFGPPGHADSNWTQLTSAGFSLENIDFYAPLNGDNLDETVRAFNDFLAKADKEYSIRVGLFGMGADGHTAGILPHSPAVDAPGLATSYQGPDYQRITVTPSFIAGLDKAYLYAMGENKHQQFDKLETDLPLNGQPAQILKQVASLTVINDYKGGSL